MNGVILYQSKYGATKKYAQWISEETGFPMIETAKASIEAVKGYDIVVLGGGIYASGIAGLSFLQKNADDLKEKKILVFCDGASPYDEESFRAVIQHNMKGKLSGIPCFYCRGAWDMEAMGFVDRSLCKLLKKAVAKKDPDEYEIWEKALMDAGDKKCDWTDRKYIMPILDELNKWNEGK